ncbi:MAG: helix-turn-helix domain-containing protein [Alistipes onderdonkii]|uniref:helix-turn-helix domain-containing protein n=1 Tax=uncultured Alistipes sp. TaxID=538949 RepID=UPI002608E5EC|nr:helix-turn-helix transcriptional regulator [uncultured Alistipes sp.]
MKHTNDTLLRSIAERLKRLRIERGYTQEVVTDRTGVNVGLYEVGTTNITVVLLTVLCNFYGVTLEEFFKDMKYEK